MPRPPSEISTEHLSELPRTSTPVRGFRLDITAGPDAGRSWRSEGERCTIGVHSSCDLVLTDPTVSRFHCELTSDADLVRIRDLDSSNGTVLDGVPVRDALLRHGSSMKLGRSSLRFQLLEQAARIPLSERTSFGRLVGRSVAMRRMFLLLERAARAQVTILLEGETGTGKSATARSIHHESERRDGPFIMLDCSSLPSNLLQSELFGHEKGAFTGAHSRRIGAFEEADGGTIFLDEIGELPIELQAKLLSVLEDREIRRVGSNHTRPVDVRVLAATNRDLRSEVNAGRFREDLYYRISVVSIEVPPLRRRLDDLPVLLDALLQRLQVPPAQRATAITPDFLQQLGRSAWPGNIRELRNHLERHLLFCDLADEHPGDELGDGPLAGQAGILASPGGDGASPEQVAVQDHRDCIRVEGDASFSDARQRAIAAFERLYVTQLLERHDGRVSRAAKAAGITRAYLYRLLQRHDVPRPVD